MEIKELTQFIRDIPDFPKPGIIFKDITPLLSDASAFAKSIDLLADRYKDEKIDVIIGVEARGFIFSAAVAYKLGVGLVPVRKPGKLPHSTHQIEYDLEYGTDSLEMHIDAIKSGDRVLVVDDLLATGGTVAAVNELIKKQGGELIENAFLVELEFLKGRDKLSPAKVFSLIKY